MQSQVKPRLLFWPARCPCPAGPLLIAGGRCLVHNVGSIYLGSPCRINASLAEAARRALPHFSWTCNLPAVEPLQCTPTAEADALMELAGSADTPIAGPTAGGCMLPHCSYRAVPLHGLDSLAGSSWLLHLPVASPLRAVQLSTPNTYPTAFWLHLPLPLQPGCRGGVQAGGAAGAGQPHRCICWRQCGRCRTGPDLWHVGGDNPWQPHSELCTPV